MIKICMAFGSTILVMLIWKKKKKSKLSYFTS